MRSAEGARWAKWDLHVHTPLSLVQHYGGDTPEAWDRFFGEVEALPPEFKVLGINDYLFLDGYKRVRAAKQQGRLANIELLLPVVELRLDKFGGTAGKLSRVNMHVIFSDALDPAVIEQQFLSALSSQYQLAPAHIDHSGRWSGVPTRESLADLGRAIIDSVPEDQRSRYGTPLIEGFNNLNVRYDQVRSALDKPYFRDKVCTAIGKTEWWDIKWNDQSVADKKTLVNGVDWVFLSAADPEHCVRAQRALADAKVNSRLLDCSDAHRFADSSDKDRIGRCFTWIHADTEFEGLRQALREPQDRVFLGVEPPARRRVAQNRTRYVQQLVVRKSEGAEIEAPWFDGTPIPLNPGLVAIIGNKGSGKSALLDIVGMMGDTSRQEYASFLSAQRFKKSTDNKAKFFEAELTWADGTTVTRPLSAAVDRAAVERVTYVPQQLFDTICNELQAAERGPFDLELKRVIFSHVEPANRLGHATLDGLLALQTSEIERSAAARRAELATLNGQIVELERRARPEHRRELANQLALRDAEISAHDAGRPTAVAQPAAELDEAGARALAELDAAQQALDEVEQSIAAADARADALTREISTIALVEQRVATFRRQWQSFVETTEPQLAAVGIALADVVTVRVNTTPVEEGRRRREEEAQSIHAQLGRSPVAGMADSTTPAPTLHERRAGLVAQVEAARARLDEPQERYQRYVAALAEWDARREALVGTAGVPGTRAALQHELAALDDAPAELAQLQEVRRQVAREIHAEHVRVADLYRTLYGPVQAFIDKHATIATEGLRLAVDVSIVDASLERGFLDRINRQRAGSFCGADESSQRVRGLLAACDFNDAESCIKLADALVDHLHHDCRANTRAPTRIEEQLRRGGTVEEVYDYLFGFTYLTPRFGLRMGERELHQLSPGEKGALLLVFYLLVDRDDTPLLIDQPEENLDNQTIFRLLVPSIKEAKRRRQILIVTHNPNLAVVCDAAQVVCAERATEGGTRLSYTSGAVENPDINRRILDVLEGTRVAFDDRGGKYQRHPT